MQQNKFKIITGAKIRVFDKNYLNNPFKQAVQNHQVQIGFGLGSCSATVAEIVAGSGFGAPGARARRWARIPDYAATAEQHLFLALQIESKLGVQNAEAIAKTEGVDAIFLGTADLAVDMGYYGDFSGEEMQATIKKLIQDIRSWGKLVDTIAGTPEEAKRYIEWGASFVVVGADVIALAHVADSLAEACQGLKK